MGLAGLRLGLLAGPAAWLNEIEKTRLPYNINVLTQISAEFSLSHQSVFDRQTAAIRQARDELFRQLQGIKGIAPVPVRQISFWSGWHRVVQLRYSTISGSGVY